MAVSLSWRARRRRRFRWSAEVLDPEPALWFWVKDCWTKRGAERAAKAFAEDEEILAIRNRRED